MSKQKLSKSEIKFEQQSKLVFFIPFTILVLAMLFLSSCSSSSYTMCDAYASVEVENKLK